MLKTPETLTSHHITVPRTARYYTLGDPQSASVERIWVVLHGYSQLAQRFIRYFEPLENARTAVVAPEGLSRFYVDRFADDRERSRQVGASWMTREDREAEIRDYIEYLDRLADTVLGSARRGSVKLGVLGFSQGCATLGRWIAGGRHRPDRMVVWGGFLPPDLDVGAFRSAARGKQVEVVIGESDEYITPGQVAEELERLRRDRIEFVHSSFEGGHHISRSALEALIRWDTG